MTSRARPGLILPVLLGLLVVAVHARGLGSDLVYDGRSQIGEDDYLHQPRHLADVLTLRVLSQDVLDGNRPTQLLSLMLDALVWGRRPFGFHLTSLLLHAGCVLLLFRFLRRWLGPETGGASSAVGPAWVGAAAFAVHPLVVEPVAEPSYREDLLVGFFLLLGLRLFERWRAGRSAAEVARAAAVLLCALAAVGAKESGVALVPVLVVAAVSDRTAAPRRAVVALLVAVALVVGGFLAARFLLAPETSIIFPNRPARLGGSFANTLLIETRIFALGLGHVLWPAGLSADYTSGSIAGVSLGLALLALVALLAVQGLLARRSRLALLGTVWFWAALLPASNLVPQYRPAADRYLYVPLMGLAALLALALAWLWPRRLAAGVALTALTFALGAAALASIGRHGVFANERALWEDTLRVSPDSTTAMNNHAWTLLDANELAAAEAAFARTVAATGGREADPLVGQAIAIFESGNRVRARQLLDAALALDGSYGDPARLRRTLRLTAAQVTRLQPLLPGN